MACFNPVTLVDDSVVPCGRCLDCILKKRDQWTFRLLQEHKKDPSVFITLTYSDDWLPRANLLNPGGILFKKHLQDYFKRVRKQVNKYPKCDTGNRKWPHKNLRGKIKRIYPGKSDLKYYAVGEYGTETKRPHYHAIVFGGKKPRTKKALAEQWKKGFTRIQKTGQGEIHYVTGYVINKLEYSARRDHKPFAIMSKGLGEDYAIKNKEFHLNLLEGSGEYYVRFPDGRKGKMPRYIANKIFDADQVKAIGKENKDIAEHTETLEARIARKNYLIAKSKNHKKLKL